MANCLLGQLKEASVKQPCPGITEILYSYSLPQEKPVAAFVVINSYRIDKDPKKQRGPRSNNEIKLLQEMSAVANANKLLFVLVEIKETSLGEEMKKKDYSPKKSFSPIIVSDIANLAGGKLPLCLYRSGGGNPQLLLELADSEQRSVAAWCLDNCLPSVEFSRMFRAPGLIICNNDRLDRDKFKQYFDDGRKQSRKWTWLEIKPIDTAAILPLVCQYFRDSSTATSELWMDRNSQIPIEADEVNMRDTKINWFPSLELSQICAGLQNVRSGSPVVIEELVQPREKELAPIKFYLRLPPGSKDGSGLSGMIAYCTWVQDRKQLMQQLLFDPDRPEKDLRMPAIQMLRYAAKNNLGVLTWSTPGKWNAAQNTDELGKREVNATDDLFDTYAEAWDRGVSEFVAKYKIPSKDYLLYGFSRGAQWAHRLALRKPDRFLAVNIHVNSSYDKPTIGASQCLWLVTTGDREHGYSGAKRFYAECQKLNYPILFKAEEALGHSSCKEVEALRDEFYDYALDIKKERDAASIEKSEMAKIVAQRINNSPYVGDYLNQQIFEAGDAVYVPQYLRVYLPTKQLADAWINKYVPEKVNLR